MECVSMDNEANAGRASFENKPSNPEELDYS